MVIGEIRRNRVPHRFGFLYQTIEIELFPYDIEERLLAPDPSSNEPHLDSNSPSASSDVRTLSLKEVKRAHKIWSRRLRKAHSSLPDSTILKLKNALKNLEHSIQNNPENCNQAFFEAEVLVNKSFQGKSPVREYAESILLAVLFALFLRAFVVEAFKIPTRSMVPTLLEGDHLFVNKFSYGIRIPFTTKHLMNFSPPSRGDVIVFIFPREEAKQHLEQQRALLKRDIDCLDRASLNEEKDYIKRVVGLPGETVQVLGQQIYIDGKAIKRSELYRRPLDPARGQQVWVKEQLGDNEYIAVSLSKRRNKDFGPVKIKADHVFVMGDNRDNSSDSRCWGQVPINNIKGKAMMIWWSSGKYGARWSRLFDIIQ